MEQEFPIPKSFQTKLFINNEFVESSDKKTLPVINPSTEEVICEISIANAQDIDLAVESAQKAVPGWSAKPQRDRSDLLFKIATMVESRAAEFIALESLNNGKPLDQAEFDISEVVTHLRYYAGWADKVTGKTYQTTGQQLNYTRREPFGVVGLIAPWNFPLLMAEWKLGPSLAAGNCVVLKPSEVTPLTILKFAEICKEAGLPKGVLNVVPGLGPIAGEAISNHPNISMISFTGSSAVGRRIMAASSQSNLKRMILELGGKSPVVICEDADVDKAAVIAWSSIMFNQGQSCDAGSRLLVHRSLYASMLEKLKACNETIVIGDPFSGANHGPQINQAQFNRVLDYINHGKDVEKLKVLIGGDRSGDKGYFIQPTIFYDVPDNSKLAREEIFGPVLVVLTPFDTFEEAIKRANDTPYGLAAYLVTNNMGNIEKFTSSVRAGSFYVNQGATSICSMPFGGYGESGFGRDNGEEGLLEYTRVKAVYCTFENPQK